MGVNTCPLLQWTLRTTHPYQAPSSHRTPSHHRPSLRRVPHYTWPTFLPPPNHRSSLGGVLTPITTYAQAFRSPAPNVICRVHSYPLKEDIMCKARSICKVVFDKALVQLYPGLAWITLQKYKLLQPLLHSLQEKDIIYHCGFPFSLTARRQGQSGVLRYLEDLEDFCHVLGIPAPQDLVATPPPLPTVWQKVSSTKCSFVYVHWM